MNFMAPPLNAGSIKDALKKLDVDLVEVSLQDILASQFLTAIDEEDIDLVKANEINDNLASGGDSDITERLEFLDTMNSRKFLEDLGPNYRTRYLVHNFKPEHGNYTNFTIAISSRLKDEDWLVPLSSSDAHFCANSITELTELLGIPELNRDKLQKSFSPIGMKYDSIESQWSLSDISIKFDCNSVQSTNVSDLKVIDNPSLDLVRAVQKALNYFGFDVGKADGVKGKKTGDGLKSYMNCLGQTATPLFLEAEIDYLLARYENTKSLKGSGNCQDLLKHRPVQVLFNLATIEIVPKLNAEKMLPIIWLACTQEKVRNQTFIYDGSDETANEMRLIIYGVDLAENKIYGESKGTVSNTVEVTDTMINFSKERELDKKSFDYVFFEGKINRVSGAF
jgi:hypothetical protein